MKEKVSENIVEKGNQRFLLFLQCLQLKYKDKADHLSNLPSFASKLFIFRQYFLLIVTVGAGLKSRMQI